MTTSLAYLGPEGTFTHQAAKIYQQNLTPLDVDISPYKNIPQILSAVSQGKVNLALVPAENSIEGSVNVTLDILAHENDLYIKGDIILDIEHHLMSYMKDFTAIHSVLSHPQALAQCRHFLQLHLSHADLLETNSTADAVKNLDRSKPGLAAIGSRESQNHYQVPLIAENIGDFSPNQTRFLLVGTSPCTDFNTKKTSLVIALKKDRPGGLYEILGEFARLQVNLTRIESRPARMELGNYIFFIDCQAGKEDPGLQQALINLVPKTALLKNLGSYSPLVSLKTP